MAKFHCHILLAELTLHIIPLQLQVAAVVAEIL